MNDSFNLETKIDAEQNREWGVPSHGIRVSADGGVAIFCLGADRLWLRLAAARVAHRLRSVRAIADEIEARLSGSVRHSDEEIAVEARRCLSRDMSIRKDAVKVSVDQGYVTLTGSVVWPHQQEDVAWMIRSLSGVTGVVNFVTVERRHDASIVRGHAVDALQISWQSAIAWKASLRKPRSTPPTA